MKRLFMSLFLICALLAGSCSGSVKAASFSVPSVLDINIGILPYDFNALTTREAPELHLIHYSVNGGAYQKGKIHIRGATSKLMGLDSPARRVPFSISTNRNIPFFAGLENDSIKFINSFTVFRLYAEYVALELFESYGIPTPAHSFVFLRFNNVDFGLYLAVEELNDAFAKKHFAQGDVFLYKARGNERYPERFQSKWFGDLASDTADGAARLNALTDALDRGEGYEQYLDLDEILRFFACTAVMGADSSILTEMNNFYLIDDHGTFLLAPWDSSEAFSCLFPGNGIDHYSVMGGGSPALFDLLMRDPQNRETYHNYIREINDTFLSPQHVEEMIGSLARETEPYLARDCTVYGRTEDPLSSGRSGNPHSFGAFAETLADIHKNLTAQLNGETDVFYQNPEQEALKQAEESDTLREYFMRYSPTVDAAVVKRICRAYPKWRLRMDFSDPEQLFEYRTAVLCFCGGAVLLAGAYALPRVKRRRPIRGKDVPRTGDPGSL